MRTPVEALKEVRDRLSYFCARLDGKYDPPWAQELVGIIDDALARDAPTPQSKAAKLPDGWKMYDKYQIRHTDGTPLKGKRYFVLRLDSDDPSEAARVVAAMSAYKGETHSGNAAKLREAAKYIQSTMERLRDPTDKNNAEFIRIWEIVSAALSAPPRNCDMFNGGNAERDAEMAWDAITSGMDLQFGDLTDREIAIIKDSMRGFVWLFTTADESEAAKL